ncbi:MAG: hypothetical protein WDO73_10770 [Ignavibacteriota bacterium]
MQSVFALAQMTQRQYERPELDPLLVRPHLRSGMGRCMYSRRDVAEPW